MSDWVTAFVALTDCSERSGCLEYESGVVMELAPGEASLHSAFVEHHARKNDSAFRRDCVALRFVSGRVRDRWADQGEPRDYAIHCWSRNRRKAPAHWIPVPPPDQDGPARRVAIAAIRSRRYT